VYFTYIHIFIPVQGLCREQGFFGESNYQCGGMTHFGLSVRWRG
jgi:hypothetical protein